MTVKKTYKYSCDLCSMAEENKTEVAPSGWLNMLIDGVIDRDFTEKHICVACVNEIHTRHRKANKLDV